MLKLLFSLVLFFSSLACFADVIDQYNDLIAKRWYLVSSDHLNIYTDEKPEKAEKLAIELEKFREIFAIATGFRPNEDIGKLTIHAVSKESFARLTKQSARIQGFFNSQFIDHDEAYLKLNSFKESNGSSNKNDYSTIFIFHEYVHYLVANSGSGQLFYPPWYNEGMAEFFSTTYMADEKTFVLGKAAAFRIRGLPDRDKRNKSLPWLNMSRIFESRVGLPTSPTSDTYAQAWLIYHYFYSNPERSAQTQDYLKRINNGETHEKAFNNAYGITPFEMDHELLKYYERGNIAYSEFALPKPISPSKISTHELTSSEKHNGLAIPFGRFIKPDEVKSFSLAIEQAYPDEIGVLDLLAYDFYENDDFTNLSRIVKKMQSISPDNRQTLLQTAHLAEIQYKKAKDPKEQERLAEFALENLKKILATNKTDAQVILNIAQALQILGVSQEKSDALITRAWQLRPQNCQLNLEVAKIFARQNNNEKALRIMYVLRNRLGDNEMPEEGEIFLAALESAANKK